MFGTDPRLGLAVAAYLAALEKLVDAGYAMHDAIEGVDTAVIFGCLQNDPTAVVKAEVAACAAIREALRAVDGARGGRSNLMMVAEEVGRPDVAALISAVEQAAGGTIAGAGLVSEVAKLGHVANAAGAAVGRVA